MKKKYNVRLNEYGQEVVRCWKAKDGKGIRSNRKPGKNEKCPCGSGKKFRKCCKQKGTK